MTPKNIVKLMEKDGWFRVRQHGSHIHFQHATKTGIVIVPYHAGRDLNTGLQNGILKQAGAEMTQEFLAVFECRERNWSAFAIDVPGTGGLGDTLDETRRNLLEGMQLYFEVCEEGGLPLPNASSGSVNFNEFDPDHKQKHYVIEWLQFEYKPAGKSRTSTVAA